MSLGPTKSVADMSLPELRKRLGIQDAGLVTRSQLNRGSYPDRSVPGPALYIPLCQVVGGAQTIANNTPTLLTGLVENIDTDSMFESTASNRITVLTEGYYDLTANVQWAANAVGDRGLLYAKNGGLQAVSDWTPAPNGAGVTPMHDLAVLVQGVEGDYFQTYVWQTSGGNLDVTLSVLTLAYVSNRARSRT